MLKTQQKSEPEMLLGKAQPKVLSPRFLWYTTIGTREFPKDSDSDCQKKWFQAAVGTSNTAMLCAILNHPWFPRPSRGILTKTLLGRRHCSEQCLKLATSGSTPCDPKVVVTAGSQWKSLSATCPGYLAVNPSVAHDEPARTSSASQQQLLKPNRPGVTRGVFPKVTCSAGGSPREG